MLRAYHVEVDLPIGSNGNANADDNHVEQTGPAEGFKSSKDGDEVHNNRRRRFEHLNEGHGQVQVRAIATGKRERIQDANWHNTPDVHLGCYPLNRTHAKQPQLDHDRTSKCTANLRIAPHNGVWHPSDGSVILQSNDAALRHTWCHIVSDIGNGKAAEPSRMALFSKITSEDRPTQRASMSCSLMHCATAALL